MTAKKKVTQLKIKSNNDQIVMTLGSLKNRKETLEYALNQKYPIKISYRLGKIVDKIESELKYIEKTRLDLINKYGKEDKKQKKVIVPDNKLKLFAKEYEELLEDEFTIDFLKLPLSAFDIKDVNTGKSMNIFTPKQLRDLDPFITEEELDLTSD